MPKAIKFHLGQLVECISDGLWDDPMAPERGEILRIDGIGVDDDGVFLSFEDTEDFFIATAFRAIRHQYKPCDSDFIEGLKKWRCDLTRKGSGKI